MESFFDEVGGGADAAAASALAASACMRHYDADEDGVLDGAELQQLAAHWLTRADGVPEPLTDAQLERVLEVLGGDVGTGTVGEAGLAAAWPTVVAPSLRPRAALLIVDVQNDFISGSLALRDCPAHEDGAAVVPVVNHLRATAPWALVVTTMDAHPPDHCSFVGNVHLHKLHPHTPVAAAAARALDTVWLAGDPPVPQILWPAHCVQGTWGEQLHPDLVVAATDVVLRKGTRADVDSYSAFWDNAKLAPTGLLAILQRAGVTDVVVCGLALDVCVRATVLDARAHGLRTTVVLDACRGVDPDGMRAACDAMAAAGAYLTTADEVPAVLQGRRRPATLALSAHGPCFVR
jgi:nicotinamidase-related amidase